MQSNHGKTLLEERLKPTPPWSFTALDLFGIFKIHDDVKKQTFESI